MIWSALLLIALFLVPGWGAWLAFSDEGRRRLSAVEGLFIISLTSLIAATLSAFILAELGLFQLPLLLLLLGVFTLATAAWGIFKRGRSPNPLAGLSFQFIDLAPFLLLALALLLSPQAFEYIVGGRDHGVYFNTGVNIARTGQILIIDPELAAVPPESRALLTNPDVSVYQHGLPGPWSEGQRLPGLTIRDASRGIILPHAFHLYPALIAIFYAVGGLSFGLSTTMVLALFGSLAFYFAGRRLFGPAPAILALFFVVINVGQMWFTRYPTAEILTRLLFWSGLFTVGLLLTKGGRFTAVIAGLSFGLMHLAKLDTFMVSIVLFLFFSTLWLRRRWSPSYTSFVIAYLGVTILALIHAYFLATIYFIDQAVRELLPPFLAQPLIEAASGRPYPVDSLRYLVLNNQLLMLLSLLFLTAIIVLAIRFRDSINNWLSGIGWLGPWAKGVLMAVLGLLTVYALSGFQVLPLEQIRVSQASFSELGWYLTPLGLILGMVGLATFVIRSRRLEEDLTWMLIVGGALPLLLLGSLTAADHFWAIRRYVPIVIPAFLLFAAYILIELLPRSRDKWLRAAIPIILGALLVVGMWRDTGRVYGIVEYEGLTEKLEGFAAYFPPESVLLFENSDAANRLTLPLWLIWDQTVFSLPAKSLTQPAFAAAVDYWSAQDRDVFWLTTGGIDTGRISELYYSYVNSFDLVLPLIERINGRIPAKAGQKAIHLDAYKIQSEPFPQPLSAVTIDSGLPSLAEVASGLYEPEVISGLTPLRWSGDSMTLTFPTGQQPLELLLEVSSPRPDEAPPAEVSIYSGDLLLATFIVGPDASPYRIKIPSGLKFDGPTVDFRIETVPWVPAQVVGSQDSRPLGLIFYWAELIFEG